MPRLVRHLRSGLRLSPREAAQAAEAAVLFHGFRLLLRVVPFRRFRWVLGQERAPDPSPDGTAEPSGPPSDAALDVRRALRRSSASYADTCLPQSLAGRLMLRRRGLPSSLYLGTRRHDGELTFHAWIVTDGLVLNKGGSDRQHAVLTAFHDVPTRPGRLRAR